MKSILFLLLSLALTTLADGSVLTLSPEAVSAHPGEITGWSFSLENDGDGYLALTGVDFTTDNGVFTGFLPANPADIWLLQSFLVIGPGQIFTQTFDEVTQQGIGPYLINDFQIPGDISTGVVTITYDYYATDPEGAGFDPDDPNHQYGLTVSAAASVEVMAPETSSWYLLGLGMGSIIMVLRRRP